MSTVFCKCGCGKPLTAYQIRKHGKYASRACQARYRRNNPDKYKLYANSNSKYSYVGEKKCLNYNDEDIKCVMCYEQDLYLNKDCRRNPREMRINGKQYCGGFDKHNLSCIICIEQAVFKCKGCYKEVK